MDWGIENRLNRIFDKKSGNALMLAIDHGYFLGPTSGLEKPYEAVKELIPHADCLMLTRGALRNCVPNDLDKPIVLRVSGGTSIVGPELLHEGTTVSMEEAIRLNASGVAYSVMVGADFERDTILDLGRWVDAGNRYGMPVLSVTAVGKNMEKDARYLALATRLSAETGAHFVKTYYCDNFEKVTETATVPVVIAGGKKKPEKEALEMAYNAISKGARGVDMGRNIFQSENPVAMIKAVKSIVHKGIDAEQAYNLYKSEAE
ncbi:MAG: 3-hydroxy-5-phosphonooxypentane-2,4-dione thiolase [Candidatus Undinarchaeales archaeon]